LPAPTILLETIAAMTSSGWRTIAHLSGAESRDRIEGRCHEASLLSRSIPSGLRRIRTETLRNIRDLASLCREVDQFGYQRMGNIIREGDSLVLREDGFVGQAKWVLGFLYRKIVRPLLPTAGSVRYGGIPISRDRKLGDMVVPVFLAPLLFQ